MDKVFEIYSQAGEHLYNVMIPLDMLSTLPTILVLPNGLVAQRYKGRYIVEDAYYPPVYDIRSAHAAAAEEEVTVIGRIEDTD